MRRRSFLGGWTAASLLRSAALPGVRQITKGPSFHWFGYYDKLQFDPGSRWCLAMQVGFEHRSPKADDVIRIGMIDTEGGDRWTDLGESHAWNWQQGSMLQWIPGSHDEVIWNDRQERRFVSVIHNVRTGKKRRLDHPVYALAPDGQWAVACDFRRLNDVRPGYGYAGIPDPGATEAAPKGAGLWRVDLKSGAQQLLLSFRDVLDIPQPKGDWKYSAWNESKHWFNHLLVDPTGKRFIFLHRWRGPKEGAGFATRMLTIDADGRNPYVLDPYGRTSHFIWRDAEHVLAWAWHPSLGKDRFYLYRDRTTQVEAVGPEVMTVNGHCTYLPGNRWILNDTYPDAQRMQHVYLYEVATGKRVPLGSFASPKEYAGEWRCDTHPRFSPDGKKVCIDSPHGGGRQMYLIDLRGVTG